MAMVLEAPREHVPLMLETHGTAVCLFSIGSADQTLAIAAARHTAFASTYTKTPATREKETIPRFTR
jgi:hypothetical protein